jgi:hypothetical protein
MAEPGAALSSDGRATRRSAHSRAGRDILIAVGGVLAGAFVAVWALPNMAGPAFLSVRALVATQASASGPTITIAGLAPVRASALNVGVEVTNAYPLGVVVGVDGVAFQAVVYRREANGRLSRAWQASLDDPALEEGSDSPVGGGSASAAAVVPSGASRHDLSGSTSGFSLLDAAGKPLAAGVYYLRVWAYGIASSLVPIAVDGGVDPLGPPSDLPAPAGTMAGNPVSTASAAP